MADPEYAAILLNFYSLAIGFVAAATCASATAVVTGQPLKFEISAGQNNLALIVGTICRIIAGPFMIIRNTLKAIMTAGREPYWVMMAIIIASLWSFCQGVIILETACRLGACAG